MIKNRIRFRMVLKVACLLTISGWFQLDANEHSKDKNRLQVVVPIEPFQYFVEKIGGESVEVMTVVSAGADPHHFSLSGKQMKFVSEAEVYFSLQLPFELQLRDRLLQSSEATVVDLVNKENDHQAEEALQHEHHHHVHDHDHDAHYSMHDHDHEGHDPHVWTDPVKVMQYIRMIRDVLIEMDSDQRLIYEKGAEALLKELETLDHQFRDLLKDDEIHRSKLLVYHPAWGHFCESYGLEQVALEKEGKAMTGRAYAELIRSIDDHFFPVILVQPQVSDRLSNQIAGELGGFKVIEMDPLAYDYPAMLAHLYAALKDG